MKILFLLLAIISTPCLAKDDASVFANGFESPLIPTNCKSIASHTDGVRDFTQWQGEQIVHYTSGETDRKVDITSFASVFQFNPGQPWPGVSGNAPIIPTPTDKYISTQFTTSADAANIAGTYGVGQTGYSAKFSMTISASCGDFSPPTSPGSTVLPYCYKTDIQARGGGIGWNGANKCRLLPGKTYWMNVINADISNVGVGSTGYATSTATAQCKEKVCTDPVQNLWGAQ